MATVPIEIVRIGSEDMDGLNSAMMRANEMQDEFKFFNAPERIGSRLSMYAFGKMQVFKLLDEMERTKKSERGYHPFLLAITDAHLEGEKLTNLFGSHRAANGVAVITTDGVGDLILPRSRMAAYFIYYFARYSLSFLSPSHKNHDDSRGCVFDRKIRKTDIIQSMKTRSLCDECRRNLLDSYGILSAQQYDALERLFALSGEILAREKSTKKGRLFIGSSREGLNIARKIQELLSSDFSVVVWNQGTVFGLGQSTLEALEAAVHNYDGAIFVFTPDDELHSRGEIKAVARDNVLFELGMFIGKLGRRRAFAVCPTHPRIGLPTDLAGISVAQYDSGEDDLAAAIGPAANQIRSALNTMG